MPVVDIELRKLVTLTCICPFSPAPLLWEIHSQYSIILHVCTTVSRHNWFSFPLAFIAFYTFILSLLIHLFFWTEQRSLLEKREQDYHWKPLWIFLHFTAQPLPKTFPQLSISHLKKQTLPKQGFSFSLPQHGVYQSTEPDNFPAPSSSQRHHPTLVLSLV